MKKPDTLGFKAFKKAIHLMSSANSSAYSGKSNQEGS